MPDDAEINAQAIREACPAWQCDGDEAPACEECEAQIDRLTASADCGHPHHATMPDNAKKDEVVDHGRPHRCGRPGGGTDVYVEGDLWPCPVMAEKTPVSRGRDQTTHTVKEQPVSKPTHHERLLSDAIVNIAVAAGVGRNYLPECMTGPQILDLAEQTADRLRSVEAAINAIDDAHEHTRYHRGGVCQTCVDIERLNKAMGRDAHAPALYCPHSPWTSHV